MTTDIPDLIAGALGVSRGTAYDMMREALEKEALHKLAAESINEGLRLDDWDKIGCVNHDCDQCKAQQEPGAWPHKLGCRANAFGKCNMGCTTPQAQPLTDDKYEAIVEDIADWSRYVEVDTAHQSLEKHVRQMLAAHGITKGNT